MTYCQKNPITLILKSNICCIKPNPYLADFLRNSKSFSHCEMLYFISNMCGLRFCRQNNKLSVWIWIPADFADNQYEISVYRTEPIFEELTIMNRNQQLKRKLLLEQYGKKESGLAGKLCGCVSSMAISPLSRSGFRKRKTQKGEKRIVEIWGQENVLLRLSYFTFNI